jgi:heme O synthase-like polyprenyltransferase
MYLALFRYSWRLFRESSEAFPKALALGFCGVLVGVAFNALLSTVFEIRTLAFYLWLYAGFVAVLGERAKRRQPKMTV